MGWVWDAIGFRGSSGEIVRVSKLQIRIVRIMFGPCYKTDSKALLQ